MDAKTAHQLQGARANAAGAWFEDLMKSRLDALEQLAIVQLWQHNEPAYRCIWRRTRPGCPPRKDFLPVAPGAADYSGMLQGGIYFSIEAKTTKDRRFPLDRISTSQAVHLDSTDSGGGLALLAVQFREPGLVRDFLVPWAKVPWERARTARTVTAELLAGYEAPRSNLALYLDPFVWVCPSCRNVYPKERQSVCARLACVKGATDQ